MTAEERLTVQLEVQQIDEQVRQLDLQRVALQTQKAQLLERLQQTCPQCGTDLCPF